MKYTILIIIFLSINSLVGQTPPDATKHIVYVDAVVYENKDTVEYKRTVSYYDSTWSVVTSTNTIGATLSNGTTVNILDTPRKKQYVDINSSGDTISSKVYIYDDHGNRTEYYQIRYGDTINKNRRTYDEFGNNLKLFNYDEQGYYLSFENKFDKHNNEIESTYYNKYGQETKKIIVKHNYKKGVIRRYKKLPGSPIELIAEIMVENGVRTSKHFSDSEGINYGITPIRKRWVYSD